MAAARGAQEQVLLQQHGSGLSTAASSCAEISPFFSPVKKVQSREEKAESVCAASDGVELHAFWSGSCQYVQLKSWSGRQALCHL